MAKLIITADVHGSYNTWLTLKNLLDKNDQLIVAGDLFDTRYGNYAHPDFQPESIKKELGMFNHDLYYVYGNCDIASFYPGHKSTLFFSAFGKSIFLHHGFFPTTPPPDTDIIIQGHTHICSLKKKEVQRKKQIYMNPGSITFPRNGIYTYGIIDRTGASLIELKTGKQLVSILF
ncbi:MAG: metallophosphoesterase family protein [Pseudomonadota bacterium]